MLYTEGMDNKMLGPARMLLRVVVVGLAMMGSGTIGVRAEGLGDVVTAWEDKLDARIGVMLRDISTDWEYTHRADERFPMTSTFKPLLCGAVLAKVDAGHEELSRQVTYQADDLVSYSPVTKEHLKAGMSVSELCNAAITLSDNTAGNLLLEGIGGPEGLTEFPRSVGGTTTRLDRWETELNEAIPGDHRDTTTPRAILATLERLLFKHALQPVSAARLRDWMINDQVTDALIRAHLPKDWIIGDKTGAGGFGTHAIVAFINTPTDETYLVAVYLTESDADFPLRNEVISDIGRALIDEIKVR